MVNKLIILPIKAYLLVIVLNIVKETLQGNKVYY